MADQALVSMAQQFTGLPMDSLIGGPLNAASKANAAMALAQTKFLLDTCFVPKTDTSTPPVTSYSPIMITMTLTRGVLTPAPAQGNQPATTEIEQVKTKFELPLLTILPLNSLAVETVDINFEMEVKSSFSEDTSETSSTDFSAKASLEGKLGWGPLSVSVTGSVSYDQKDSSTHDTHYQKSNSAKYTVNVHAGQLPLPKGVNIILDQFTRAIEPIVMPTSSTGGGGGGNQ